MLCWTDFVIGVWIGSFSDFKFRSVPNIVNIVEYSLNLICLLAWNKYIQKII